uniref:SNF-related serine/threonine-protein kinase n=1 Tax=Glossina palpalis gambiensis TaxID=67801 RepID=A0A1B0AM47_9MUSC
MQHQQHTRTLEASAAAHTTGGASYDGQIAGLYDLEETLGSGHFAVVKLARHVFTGAKVAVKVVDKTKLDDVSKAHLFQEVRCMKLVQHPNVVRLYEVIDTKNKLYLVLELGDGGDLYDYIMKHDGGLTENLARKYFRQILRAITYCHQLHVVHRDLKPENVVFFEKLGVVKLTDFGFSNKFSPGQKLQTFCGSLAYSAPEILLGDSYDAPAVDIWSLGVILYMLVCGNPPFEKANDSETLTMIMDCKYTVPTQVSPDCRRLIGSMLVRDPKKRATIEQIAADPWVKENAEIDDADFLPLVKREQISEEDHAFIVQKMINGNIASKEEILQALDKDKYNHITATYFLLAEIRLRKRREEQLRQNSLLSLGKMKSNFSAGMGSVQGADIGKTSQPVKVPINIICSPEILQNESKNDKRSRKCSIVREEDEEESSHELSCEGNELKVAITRRESISDGRLHRSVQERALNSSKKSNIDDIGAGGDVLDTIETQTKMVVSVDATLAQKLNEMDIQSTDKVADLTATINNSNQTISESLEIQDTLRGLEELKLKSSKNPVLTHHRRHSKLNKIRTPSCSSSEASDEDTKTRSKKKIHKFVGDTPTRFRVHRRDSHDDSSDSQDQGCPPSGAHAGHDAANLITTNSSNVTDNKKDGQTQNKSEDTRHHKSSTHSYGHNHKCKNKQSKEGSTATNDKHCSLAEKAMQLQAVNLNSRRRRIRESQSLDRITEAQEYDLLRHRSSFPYAETQCNYDQRISLFNLHAFPEAKEEEYDDEGSENHSNHTEQFRNSLNIIKEHGNTLTIRSTVNNNNSLQHNHSTGNSIYKLNSIEEIDLILHEKSLTKTLQTTSSKCFVTIKKIRKLGKYFPVVNFS